ncbi:unnamed protein product [Heterobilharzia americana]|nr:unnamed protein product [Heterobilharzia americana]
MNALLRYLMSSVFSFTTVSMFGVTTCISYINIAGAIAAACLVCDLDIDVCIQYFCKIVENAKQYTLGPFDPRFKINAHILCSNRLSFKDKEELIKALLCSAYIPIFSGFVPLTFRGQLVLDGGLSDNLLNINQQTIKVSPFAGDADICPLESKWGPQYHRAQPQSYEDVLGSITLLNLTMRLNLTNIERFIGMVWPMSSDQLAILASQGYDDALRFLITRGFIACRLHRTPREFSNISRTKQRSLSRIHRLPSFDTFLCNTIEDESDLSPKSSTGTNSDIQTVKSTRFSTPRPPIHGSGIGLNVAHCRSCQNGLRKAFNSSFPSSLRSLIREGTNPPPSYIRCIKNCIWSYGSSVCSFGFNLIRPPLNLQIKLLMYVVSKCVQLLERSQVNTDYLLSLLDVLKKSYNYLEKSTLNKICPTNNMVRSVGEMNEIDLNSISPTEKRYHRPSEENRSVVSVINSVLEKGADNMSDLLLRLSSVELPTAEDCGLELLSSRSSQFFDQHIPNLCSLQTGYGGGDSDFSQTDSGLKLENEDSETYMTYLNKSDSISNFISGDIDSSTSYSTFEN